MREKSKSSSNSSRKSKNISAAEKRHSSLDAAKNRSYLKIQQNPLPLKNLKIINSVKTEKKLANPKTIKKNLKQLNKDLKETTEESDEDTK